MLPCLPSELQLRLVSALRPPRLPTGTKPCLNPAFLSHRDALHSLCRTSRRLHAIAAPLLYETIALTRDVSIIQLFSTLLADRSRRAWIRSIACPLDLMQETDLHAGLPVWNMLVARRQGRRLDAQGERALEVVDLTLNHIPEGLGVGDGRSDLYDQILGAILCLTTGLEDVLLQLPPTNEEVDGYDHVHAALEQGIDASDTGVLPSLRSVRIQAPALKVPAAGYISDPRLPRRRQASGIDPMRLPTFEIEGVQEVEFDGDDGLWFYLLRQPHHPAAEGGGGGGQQLLLPRDLQSFRGLRALRLRGSRTAPEYLACLLAEARGLRAFEYTTRAREWRRPGDFAPAELDGFYFEPPAPALRATATTTTGTLTLLDEALWPLRATVRDLRLGSARRRADDGRAEFAGLGAAPLRVLGAFERLARLVIDLRWLVPVPASLADEEAGGGDRGSGGATTPAAGWDVPALPLRERLPGSLEELELVETWASSDLCDFHQSEEIERRGMAYSQTALCALLPTESEEMLGVPGRFSRLRSVTLRASKPMHQHASRRPSEARTWSGHSGVDVLDAHGQYWIDFEATPLKTKEGIEAMSSLFQRNGVKFKVEWWTAQAPWS